jgi:hypothetical protein
VPLEKYDLHGWRRNVWSPWQLRHLDHSMRSRWTTTWPGTLIMEVWWVEKDLHAKEWRQERSKAHHCQDFHRVVRSKRILSEENEIIRIILDSKLVQASVRDGWVKIFYAQKNFNQHTSNSNRTERDQIPSRSTVFDPTVRLFRWHNAASVIIPWG